MLVYIEMKRIITKFNNLLEYQQTLVKETVEGDNFDGITVTLRNLLSTSVILLDRFLRPLSFKLYQMDEEELHPLVELATYKIIQSQQPTGSWFTPNPNDDKKVILGLLMAEVIY